MERRMTACFARASTAELLVLLCVNSLTDVVVTLVASDVQGSKIEKKVVSAGKRWSEETET